MKAAHSAGVRAVSKASITVAKMADFLVDLMVEKQAGGLAES